MSNILETLHLGKKIDVPSTYSPEILQRIPRNTHLDYGWDIWNLYELYWSDMKGSPKAFRGVLYVPRSSKFILESKSVKLYLNSLNLEKFSDADEVKALIIKDISKLLEIELKLEILDLNAPRVSAVEQGICLDDLEYLKNLSSPYFSSSADQTTSFLDSGKPLFYSNCLRSICPVTTQPDFGTVVLEFSLPISKDLAIDLRSYILSKNNKPKFHESCLDDIFLYANSKAPGQKIKVYAHYTRRGGIDICPYRSNYELERPEIVYFARQ